MARRVDITKKQPVHLGVTWCGWLFLALSMLVGLAAVRSQMPMMYIIFGTMISAVVFSSVLARGMIYNLEIQRELPGRAWQHETLYFGYFIRNLRNKPCMAITLQELVQKGVEDSKGYCLYLGGRMVFRAGSRLAIDHRGRVDFTGVRLTTTFPFGLIKLRHDVYQASSIVVWPAKGRLKGDLLHHGASMTSTAQPSRWQGGQDEFFGLREYRTGDNPRWIHWRRSAGKATPVVREMSHPLPDILFIILDTGIVGSDEVAAQDREKQLRFCATVIDNALGRGYQVGLALAGETEPIVMSPSSGMGARNDLLDTLAEVADSAEVKIEDVIPELEPASLRHSQTLLISPRPQDIEQRRINQLMDACRHLEVIGPGRLDAVFDDHHLIQEELNQPEYSTTYEHDPQEQNGGQPNAS